MEKQLIDEFLYEGETSPGMFPKRFLRIHLGEEKDRFGETVQYVEIMEYFQSSSLTQPDPTVRVIKLDSKLFPRFMKALQKVQKKIGK